MLSNLLSATIVQLIFLIVLVFVVVRFKIAGQKIALIGFLLLFVTMIFSLFHNDDAAGLVAEYVWILFAVAFVQEFIHFLNHENK